MGEDIGKLGGVFRITDGLQKDFGEDRVIDTPLAESGIIGTAVGLAMRGYRPVCEIQFDGFVFPAYDQIVTQVAKIHYRSQGKLPMPIVIRIPFGGGIGAVEHHSESPEAYFAHTAGLKVVAVLQPGRRLLDDPAGHRLRRPGRLPRAQAAVLGEGRGRRRPATPTRCSPPGWCAPGTDVHGRRLRPDGARPRWRRPRPPRRRAVRSRSSTCARCRRWTWSRCSTSVRRTGRLVVVHEAPVNLGLGAEIAARVTERCFYSLEAPVLRVGRLRHALPAVRLEEEFLPDLDRVLDAVDRDFGLVSRMSRTRSSTLPDLGEGLTEGEILSGWSPSATRSRSTSRSSRWRRRRRRSSSRPVGRPGRARSSTPRATTVDVGTPIITIDTDPSGGRGDPAGGGRRLTGRRRRRRHWPRCRSRRPRARSNRG